MKWISYLVILCAIIDLVVINRSIHNNVDVFAPGFYVLILAGLIIYTLMVTYLINRYSWLDERPILSFFILAPSILYLFFHLIILIVNIVS